MKDIGTYDKRCCGDLKDAVPCNKRKLRMYIFVKLRLLGNKDLRETISSNINFRFLVFKLFLKLLKVF